GELVELEVDGGVPQVRAHRSVTARGGDPDEGAVLAGRNVGEVEDAGPGVLVGSQGLEVVDGAAGERRPHHRGLDLLRLSIGCQIHFDLRASLRDLDLGPGGLEPVAVGGCQVDRGQLAAARLHVGVGGVGDVDALHLEHVAVLGGLPSQGVVAGFFAVGDAGELGQSVDHVVAFAVDVSAQ